MQVFYLNIPWIIDSTEYNCSGRSLSQWKNRGSVNIAQGVYFASFGVIFVTLYVLCLVGMLKGRVLLSNCYRLMFFNGIIDIVELFCGSFLTAYFHFTGAVFCSSIALNWFAGQLAYSAWCGATFNCVVLALNRTVEMTTSKNRLHFLFRGKVLYFWMAACIFYMAVRPFITRPNLYNSAVSAFIGPPVITDDMEWETSYYTLLFLPIHNVTVLVLLVFLYIILCYNVFKIRGLVKSGIDRIQIQLFIQALLICLTTAITSLLYIYLEFFPAPQVLIIAANVIWQLNHGLHAIAYLCANRQIRREVKNIFKSDKSRVASQTINFTVTAVN